MVDLKPNREDKISFKNGNLSGWDIGIMQDIPTSKNKS